MTGTTATTQPPTAFAISPRRVLVVMVAVLAVSAAIAFGPPASDGSAGSADVVNARVDYAIRHLGEVSSPQASPRTADYGLRHLEQSISGSSDYGLRHLGG